MSWSEETKIRLQVFCFGMAFVCPALLAYWAPETKRQLSSRNWPTVGGEVERTVVKPWLDSKGNTKYFGRVSCRYVVDGKEFFSDLTDLGPGTKRLDPQTAAADVAEYTPGMKVTVYYDPADPQLGIIKNGIPAVHVVVLTLLVLGSVLGIFTTGLTIWNWIRKREATATERDLSDPNATDTTPSGVGSDSK